MQEFRKAAQKFKEDTPYIPFGQVDCSVQSNLEQLYDISSYPTLLFFVYGQAIEYSGGMTEEDIIQWINEKVEPSITEIFTEEDFNKY